MYRNLKSSWPIIQAARGKLPAPVDSAWIESGKNYIKKGGNNKYTKIRSLIKITSLSETWIATSTIEEGSYYKHGLSYF